MLKTVSSITNAIGALNYKGTWDANANSPALTSSVGTKGDYYVVGTAGSTNLNGISNWGIGDWAAFNGSVWQRVEGGANLNGVDLSVSGTSTLSGLTASTALALDASKNIVSVTNTGTGNNVLASSPSVATPTLTGDVQMSTGNLVVGTSGKGIDFSATPGTGTSELLADYEEGTWTPSWSSGVTSYTGRSGTYTKVGRQVTVWGLIQVNVASGAGGNLTITGLPFNAAFAGGGGLTYCFPFFLTLNTDYVVMVPNSSYLDVFTVSASSIGNLAGTQIQNGTYIQFWATYQV
jgi:hypothetical protein